MESPPKKSNLTMIVLQNYLIFQILKLQFQNLSVFFYAPRGTNLFGVVNHLHKYIFILNNNYDISLGTILVQLKVSR